MDYGLFCFLSILALSFLCYSNGDDEAPQTTKRPKRYRKINKTIRWTTEAFMKEALDKVNELRAKHNAEPLVLDNELAWDAEEYAKKVGEHCEVLGSCRPFYSHRKLTGENVWVSETETSVTGDVPVMAWYNEQAHHNFSNNIFHFSSSEFTQLVWKNSKRFGIGFATSAVKKFLVVVARFLPNGNFKYVRSFAENVEPAKSRKRRSFEEDEYSEEEVHFFPDFKGQYF